MQKSIVQSAYFLLAMGLLTWLYLRMTSADIGTESPENPPVIPAACRTSSAREDAAVTKLPTLLTASEAADILRVGTWSVVKLCRDRELPATKPGKAWLIDLDDLRAYIDASSNQKAS